MIIFFFNFYVNLKLKKKNLLRQKMGPETPAPPMLRAFCFTFKINVTV